MRTGDGGGDGSGVLALGLDVLTSSAASRPDAGFGLRWRGHTREVVIVASRTADWLSQFEGERVISGDCTVLIGEATAKNAAALRRQLPWLVAVPVGLGTSAGFGDRLGLATRGHVRALRRVGGPIAPVFAQQSIREMARTARTSQDVMDDAMWGVFAEGWRGGFGSDADHLKTAEDIDRCVAAGFTGFTLDPGDVVDASADTASGDRIRTALDRLPWDALEDRAADLLRRFDDRTPDLGGFRLRLTAADAARAAMKYGRAVARVTRMYRHLASLRRPGTFELEVSIDEADAPTSHAEHYYVAAELKRLGVTWTGLAPRFVGRLEKGVDYIGDLQEFERDVRGHAAIARHMGPYKLSLHSGSDKFSIYPLLAAYTRGLVHVKTAGTSYLEALRTIASVRPDLFRAIYAFARTRYERDRRSYHVSAALEGAPDAAGLAAVELPSLLDRFDSRQILHVTFGSVLTARGGDGQSRFYDSLMSELSRHHERYSSHLQTHFVRHLAPFLRPGEPARALSADHADR